MRILITAGPTREYFDPVRFISNPSTGKMGYALARAASDRQHDVILVSGPVALDPPPPPVELIRVTTAAEMLTACEEAFPACNAAIMSAAVSDWSPVERAEHKLPKLAAIHTLHVQPTPDICAALGARKGRRVVIGFALQDDDARPRAEEKMRRKHCDAIVLNAPETLGSDEARVFWKTADEPWSEPLAGSKLEVARSLIARVEQC